MNEKILEPFRNPEVNVRMGQECKLRSPDDTTFLCRYQVIRLDNGDKAVQIANVIPGQYGYEYAFAFVIHTLNRLVIEEHLYQYINKVTRAKQ